MTRAKISFKAISILLVVMLAVSQMFALAESDNSDGASAYSVSHPLNGTDVYRDSNWLVVYTPATGKTTKSNEWGFEVTVGKDGRVTKIGGNNSSIPEGGFVVSGHDSSATFLKTNVKLGMRCEHDNSSVTFTFDGKSALIEAKELIRQTESLFENRKEACILGDFKAARKCLDDADELVSAADVDDPDTCMNVYNKVLELTREADRRMSENVAGEYRGVWVRPAEHNQEEVAKRVQELYDNGVNVISLESFFGGYTVFPTPNDCLYHENPSFNGFDALQAYIEECHKRGMELHIWMEICYCGGEDTFGVPKEHPDWLLKDDSGNTAYPSQYGPMYFINLNNKEATDALVKFYTYVLQHYKPDAFELDYIRYPGLNWGYNDDIRNAFKEKTGIMPEHDTEASYWDKWCRFRMDIVTAFVRRLRELVNSIAPEVLLTADVAQANTYVLQDYYTWMKEHLVDMVHPMLYGKTAVRDSCEDIIANSDGTPVVPGLCIQYDELGPYDMLDQIIECRQFGCAGAFLFQAVEYLGKGCPAVLKDSAYSGPAFLPYTQNLQAVQSRLELMQERIDKLLLPEEMITKDEADGITAAIKDLKDTLSSTKSVESLSPEKLSDAIAVISNDRARDALLHDLDAYSTLTRFTGTASK